MVYDPYGDPYFASTTEPEDLVSKGLLSDPKLVAKLDTTLKLSDVDLSKYDAVHVAGRREATFDLFPSDDVAKALEHFWAEQKVVGAICPGAIALGNNPDRIRGRKLTGYTLEGDQALQSMSEKIYSFRTTLKPCWKTPAESDDVHFTKRASFVKRPPA